MISVFISTAISREGSRRSRLSSASSSERPSAAHRARPEAPRAPVARSPAPSARSRRASTSPADAPLESSRATSGSWSMKSSLRWARPSPEPRRSRPTAPAPRRRSPAAAGTAGRRSRTRRRSRRRSRRRPQELSWECSWVPAERSLPGQVARLARVRISRASSARQGPPASRSSTRRARPAGCAEPSSRRAARGPTERSARPRASSTSGARTDVLIAAMLTRPPARREVVRRQLGRPAGPSTPASIRCAARSARAARSGAARPVTCRSGPIGSASNRIAVWRRNGSPRAGGDHRDLDHPPGPVGAAVDLHDHVDRTVDVLAQRLRAGHGRSLIVASVSSRWSASSARVGVHGHQRALVAGVERLEHVERLHAADLADDDPVRAHAQRSCAPGRGS